MFQDFSGMKLFHKDCNISDISLYLCLKIIVTLRMDCVLAGTSLSRMTSTGHGIRDPRGPPSQVLHLGMAAMVSLLNI